MYRGEIWVSEWVSNSQEVRCVHRVRNMMKELTCILSRQHVWTVLRGIELCNKGRYVCCVANIARVRYMLCWGVMCGAVLWCNVLWCNVICCVVLCCRLWGGVRLGLELGLGSVRASTCRSPHRRGGGHGGRDHGNCRARGRESGKHRRGLPVGRGADRGEMSGKAGVQRKIEQSQGRYRCTDTCIREKTPHACKTSYQEDTRETEIHHHSHACHNTHDLSIHRFSSAFKKLYGTHISLHNQTPSHDPQSQDGS